MLRIVLGIIVGIVAGSLIFLGFQSVNAIFFPYPDGIDFTNQDEIRKFIAGLPPAGFILLLVGYAVGSLGAGFIARKISRHASIIAPVILGAFFSMGWLMNTSMLPHPTWVVVMGYLMYLPFTLLGHKFAG